MQMRKRRYSIDVLYIETQSKLNVACTPAVSLDPIDESILARRANAGVPVCFILTRDSRNANLTDTEFLKRYTIFDLYRRWFSGSDRRVIVRKSSEGK